MIVGSLLVLGVAEADAETFDRCAAKKSFSICRSESWVCGTAGAPAIRPALAGRSAPYAHVDTALMPAVLPARVLTPHELGPARMTLLFTGLGGVFSNLALSWALIQRETCPLRTRRS
jgi:hypothetical protein